MIEISKNASSDDVLRALKKAGTAQNVKIYRRHGAKGDLFGVSFATLKTFTKVLKNQTDLAMSLWDSGNVDARTLGLMIADPETVRAKTIDQWAGEVDYSLLAGYLAGLVQQSRFADGRMEKWTASKKEFVRDCGFSLLSARLKSGDPLTKTSLRRYLKLIEKEIHSSPNWAKNSMNQALMAMGVFRDDLVEEVLQTADRIGKVKVDHGETCCKTPLARPYIERSRERLSQKIKSA